MNSLLVRLYPARWRARYGDEFEAILEERPLGPGSTLFAIATYRTGALSRGAAVLLGAGSMLTIGAGFGGNILPPVLLILTAIAFALGWFALGVHAVRIDQPATAAGPA